MKKKFADGGKADSPYALMAELNDMARDFDRDNSAGLKKSKLRGDRQLGAEMDKRAADNTSAMIEVSGGGKRIGKDGKPSGPVLEKNPKTGLYITEKEKEDERNRESQRMTKKYAKGGSIDGIAQRGKTNCKMR